MRRALIAASLALFAGASHANTLTFDEANICTTSADGSASSNAVCGNGLFIQQSYGDVAGVGDAVYSQPDQLSTPSLKWWFADYNELHGVLWADGGDGASHARLELQALGGP